MPTKVYNYNDGKTYYTNVGTGNIPGTAATIVLGRTEVVGSEKYETLWDQGGEVTFLTEDTQLYISSDDALDTGVLISVSGVDENLMPVTRTATTNGQSQVALDGDMFFVNNSNTSGPVSPVGNIYIAELDTLTAGVPDTQEKIQAKMPLVTFETDTSAAGLEFAHSNFSHNGFVIIPAGKTGIVPRILGFVGKDQDALFSGRVKFPGQTQFGRFPIPVYQGDFEVQFDPPLILPAGTVFLFRVKGGSGLATTATIQMTLVLKDND